MFRDHLQFCIYTGLSHILAQNVKKCLYGLCSLQTNLPISFHHQSDVLPCQGTTFKELLLSSEIRNPMGKTLQRIHLRSGLPDLTSYHSCSPDASTGSTSEYRAAWPKDSPNVMLTWHSTALGHQIHVLGTSELRSTRPNSVLSWVSLTSTDLWH